MRTVENLSPEWIEIKELYLHSDLTIREIARRKGVSDTAIRKAAKKYDWKRGGVDEKPQREPRPSRTLALPKPDFEEDVPRAKIDEAERIIERAAEAEPAELIKAGRVIIEMLLRELKVVSAGIDVIEQVIEDETSRDKSPQRYNAMMKAVSLPVRTMAAKNLATALRTLDDAGPGKKEEAKRKAETAGQGSIWGDDLEVGVGRAN